MSSITDGVLSLLPGKECGTAAQVRKPALACAFVGAVLMDLAFAIRIDTTPAPLSVVDRIPTGNPVLDRVVAKNAKAELTARVILTWRRFRSMLRGPGGSGLRCHLPRERPTCGRTGLRGSVPERS